MRLRQARKGFLEAGVTPAGSLVERPRGSSGSSVAKDANLLGVLAAGLPLTGYDTSRRAKLALLRVSPTTEA